MESDDDEEEEDDDEEEDGDEESEEESEEEAAPVTKKRKTEAPAPVSCTYLGSPLNLGNSNFCFPCFESSQFFTLNCL